MYNPMDENMRRNMDARYPHGGRARHRNRGPVADRFNDFPACMPRDFDERGEGPHRMPRDFDERDGGPRRMPRDFDARGEGPHCMPRDFDERDEGPRCMPRGHGGPGRSGPGNFGPGGFGPGGMPPRRPDPQFLKRRIEESDLMALIDMAGRMAQRRPQGGPARSQSLILSILAGRDALSQRELQQMLGIKPGSLSELISKLQAKGYLCREKGEDRRGNLLRITESGRAAIATADDLPEDDPFDALSVEEQNQLAALLRKLLNDWADGLENAPPRERRAPVPCRDRPVEI